jgi:hypothetical protein
MTKHPGSNTCYQGIITAREASKYREATSCDRRCPLSTSLLAALSSSEHAAARSRMTVLLGNVLMHGNRA